jgi:hypothetical protein
MLAACESSGRVRDAFAARGWDAWSCDLEPSETPGQHIQGDILGFYDLLLPGRPFDLVIAFPPCTDLSLAGARFWPQKRADGRQDAAAEFFMRMLWDAPAGHVAVENPRGDITRRFRPPNQIVEPWWFGDPYSKKTCLWTYDLPDLVADKPVEPVGRVATGGGSWRTDKAAGQKAMSAYEDSEGRKNRARVRSRTFPGLARAMAEQWGSYLESQ